MKRRPRSDMQGWKPRPKFTCGLNVSQAQWDKIFGSKEEKEARRLAEPPLGWERCEPTKDNPWGERPIQSFLTNPRDGSNSSSQ